MQHNSRTLPALRCADAAPPHMPRRSPAACAPAARAAAFVVRSGLSNESVNGARVRACAHRARQQRQRDTPQGRLLPLSHFFAPPPSSSVPFLRAGAAASPPTTKVTRNKNMSALQAGYLFPEARAMPPPRGAAAAQCVDRRRLLRWLRCARA
jgi:hypothetical protein